MIRSGVARVLKAVGLDLGLLRTHWRAFLMSDLLAKGLGVAVLAPLTATLWRSGLAVIGTPVVTDAQIAGLLFRPLGWAAFVVLGAVSAAAGLIGLAAQVRVAGGRAGRGFAGGLAAVGAALHRGPGMALLAGVLIGAVLVGALPLGLIAGWVYARLLSEHDINYYLTARPPAFWAAAVVMAVLGAAWVAWIAYCVSRWGLSLPAYLLEDRGPGRALQRSNTLGRGRRRALLARLAGWLLAAWCLSASVTLLMGWGTGFLGGRLGPDTSLWWVALLTGAAVVLWTLAQLAVSALASIALAVVLTDTWRRLGGGGADDGPAPSVTSRAPSRTIRGGSPRRVILLAASASAVVLMAIGASILHRVPMVDRVLITAHRGASASEPENTLRAFEAAITAGADYIELDVQETRDGRLAVTHDKDLLRQGGPGTKVWSATLAELQAADLGGGARVPELGDVLAVARGRVRVNIELKVYGHGQRLEERVIEVVEAHEMADQVVVMSLDARSVQRMRELRPSWTVGRLVARAVGDVGALDSDFLAVQHALATPRFVRAAHRRGQAVHVWTVNDPVLISSMISRGVDAIITDDPQLARAVLTQRAMLGPIERMLVDISARLGVRLKPLPDDLDTQRP